MSHFDGLKQINDGLRQKKHLEVELQELNLILQKADVLHKKIKAFISEKKEEKANATSSLRVNNSNIATLESQLKTTIGSKMYNVVMETVKAEIEDEYLESNPVKKEEDIYELLCSFTPKELNSENKESVVNETHEESAVNETHEESAVNETHEESVVNETHEESVVNETHEESVVNETHEESVVNEEKYEQTKRGESAVFTYSDEIPFTTSEEHKVQHNDGHNITNHVGEIPFDTTEKAGSDNEVVSQTHNTETIPVNKRSFTSKMPYKRIIRKD